MNKRDVAAMIDHTILKPEATTADVARIVEEGAAAGTFSVCVSPSMLPLDVPEGLKVACVVGFPSGAVKPQVKAFEAAQAVADGADEIDMVINIELVKDARLHELEEEIKAVRRVVPAPRVLKVIIESAALSDDEIVAACTASMAAGADFVKTSTGFHPAGGASVHAVALMRATVGERSNMMHKRRENISALLFTHLTEWILRQVTVTNASPCAAVSLVLIVATSESFVVSLHNFFVRLTVTAFSIRKIRTSCHSTRALWFSRHCVSPFRHEKTSAGIAPIGGRAFKHTFHNTILPCQHWNSREL